MPDRKTDHIVETLALVHRWQTTTGLPLEPAAFYSTRSTQWATRMAKSTMYKKLEALRNALPHIVEFSKNPYRMGIRKEMMGCAECMLRHQYFLNLEEVPIRCALGPVCQATQFFE